MKKAIEALHQEERSGSKGRKWRKNVKAAEKVHLFFKYSTDQLFFELSFDNMTDHFDVIFMLYLSSNYTLIRLILHIPNSAIISYSIGTLIIVLIYWSS